jgi:hypothetical protein
MWEPRRLTTLWAFMGCYRDSFTFTYLIFYLTNININIFQDVKIATESLHSSLHFFPIRPRTGSDYAEHLRDWSDVTKRSDFASQEKNNTDSGCRI